MVFISSGCKPWIPKSITVRFPISIISCWICFSVFFTTSSIRAGWILPSVTKLCNDNRAISLLTGSKQDKIMASGVSSTIISTPVAASKARIFRPSRPIIRPFTSSDSILNTETQFSTVCSTPTRWMVFNMTLRASCCAVNLASSIVSWMLAIASDFACSFREAINSFLASTADNPEITSSWSTCLRWSLSTSSVFRS